ncbi:hypothetical protein NEOC65_000944 [Neochlamydia sp. AcF65]|nr:hypothetical protein [Neochlamydia sp. AcF65]
MGFLIFISSSSSKNLNTSTSRAAYYKSLTNYLLEEDFKLTR